VTIDADAIRKLHLVNGDILVVEEYQGLNLRDIIDVVKEVADAKVGIISLRHGETLKVIPRADLVRLINETQV